MRTITRFTLVAAIVGGGALLGAPAALAQTAPCAYPFDCPATGGGSNPAAGGGKTPAGSTSGAGTSTPNAGGGSSTTGAAAVLPFTGGEIVLLTATGAGALAAGSALLVAGRRRSAQV